MRPETSVWPILSTTVGGARGTNIVIGFNFIKTWYLRPVENIQRSGLVTNTAQESISTFTFGMPIPETPLSWRMAFTSPNTMDRHNFNLGYISQSVGTSLCYPNVGFKKNEDRMVYREE